MDLLHSQKHRKLALSVYHHYRVTETMENCFKITFASLAVWFKLFHILTVVSFVITKDSIHVCCIVGIFTAEYVC